MGERLSDEPGWIGKLVGERSVDGEIFEALDVAGEYAEGLECAKSSLGVGAGIEPGEAVGAVNGTPALASHWSRGCVLILHNPGMPSARVRLINPKGLLVVMSWQKQPTPLLATVRIASQHSVLGLPVGTPLLLPVMIFKHGVRSSAGPEQSEDDCAATSWNPLPARNATSATIAIKDLHFIKAMGVS